MITVTKGTGKQLLLRRIKDLEAEVERLKAVLCAVADSGPIDRNNGDEDTCSLCFVDWSDDPAKHDADCEWAQAAQAAEKEPVALPEQKDLPQIADLHNAKIDITGGMDSVAFVRRLRDGGDGECAAEKEVKP